MPWLAEFSYYTAVRERRNQYVDHREPVIP